MTVLYAQTSGSLSTNASQFTPIPGLALPLPEGDQVLAQVTVNLPNPYAEGNNYPGATIGLSVNGKVSPVVASFTYNEQQPQSSGRVPTTLVIGVPLIIGKQTVEAVWYGVRGSTVRLDSPATLTVTI